MALVMKAFSVKTSIRSTPERIWALLTDAAGYVPRRMVWTGGMPLGFFKGKRTFTLTPAASGEVEFSMREEYTGLMAPLICRSIPDLKPAFDQFAEDLKRATEPS